MKFNLHDMMWFAKFYAYHTYTKDNYTDDNDINEWLYS